MGRTLQHQAEVSSQQSQDAPWAAFWERVAREATAALEDVPADHPRAGEALWAANAARSAAGLPLLPLR